MKFRRFPKFTATLLVVASAAMLISGCTSGHDRHQFSYKKKYKTLPSPAPVKLEGEIPITEPALVLPGTI